ncbi:hypothetical protein AAAC51_27030 [Priestia megaterium]
MKRIGCIASATFKKGAYILNESEKVTLELTKEELMKFQRLMELHNEEEDKKSKREEEDRNSNFVQFYRDGMPEMRWLMTNHQFASSLLFLFSNIWIIETL